MQGLKSGKIVPFYRKNKLNISPGLGNSEVFTGPRADAPSEARQVCGQRRPGGADMSASAAQASTRIGRGRAAEPPRAQRGAQATARRPQRQPTAGRAADAKHKDKNSAFFVISRKRPNYLECCVVQIFVACWRIRWQHFVSIPNVLCRDWHYCQVLR